MPSFPPRRSLAVVASAAALGAVLLSPSTGSAAPLTAQHLPPEPLTSSAGSGSAAETAATAAAAGETAVSTGPQPGSYAPLAHGSRLLARTVAAGSVTTVRVAGRGGVPNTGAGSAVVEVTGSHAAVPGALVAFSGRRPPDATVHYAPGLPATGTAIVPLAQGRLKIANLARRGSVRAVLDVVGYYRAGASSEPGSYHPLTPARVLTPTALGANKTLRPVVGGKRGVPARAGTVAVSITASRVRAGGVVLAGDGASTPTAAVAHVSKRQVVSAFAVLPLRGRRIGLRNGSAGSLSLAVDVLGYYNGGVPQTADTLGPLVPRPVAARPVSARGSVTVGVGGRDGVPKARVAAVLATLHAVNPAKSGALQASGAASAVSFAARRSAADTVLLPVSRGGVTIHNASGGRVTVQLDIRGYVPGNAVPQPTGAATARYLNALVDSTSDPNYLDTNATTMTRYGCDDAEHGYTFVLLDVGVQSVTGPQLSTTKPGALIALTAHTRLTYTDLNAAIRAYLTGYNSSTCNRSRIHVKVAIGTNNDGAYSGKSAYGAARRGTDWATKVVEPLATTAATYRDSVVGADDIEAQFAGTETQAEEWEAAYLGHAKHKLIYNGDANDCPSTFGVTGRTCAYGWTQQQYYNLAHQGARIQVLPQVFFPGEAVKWANIDATGGGALSFAGALTEHGRVPSQLNGNQGRTALFRAISSVVTAPAVPFAADLRADAG